MLGVEVVEDKYREDSYLISGRLLSGREVLIADYYYDLRKHIGRPVEMLLSFIRSPFYERKMGIKCQIFSPEEFYSVKVVNELMSEEKVASTDNAEVVVLTGEYIVSYTIPDKWSGFNYRRPFKSLFKMPSALKTQDGMFLLYPFHSQRQEPLEQIPQKITMAGSLKLEAWRLI